MNDLKTQIQQRITAFQKGSLRGNALDLFNTLGYASAKTLDLDGTSDTFLEQFDARNTLRKDKTLFNDWKEIQLLFQLTDEEIKGTSAQAELAFDSNAEFDGKNYKS